MTQLHPYYHRLLATLLQRLVSPHIDEEQWQEELTRRQEAILVKERIWARTPGELERHLPAHIDQIDGLLELTTPSLKQLMHYREEGERRDYTRLTVYRGALLEERARARAVLDALLPIESPCAMNDPA